MKVAVLSDIHGNSVALEAVLAEAEKAGVEHLLTLGDFVGYYYRPDEVLAQLAKFNTTMIRGNHETMMEAARDDEQSAEKIRARYGSGVNVALKKLSEEQVAELLALPQTSIVTLDGVRFLLAHGSPWDNNEYIYPDTDEAVHRKCAAEEADFVLLGHTHYPFMYARDGAVVLNPGSVGQPRDTGNSASWAIIDTNNRSVVHKRTMFDITALLEEAERIDPDIQYLRDVLKRNTI